MKRNICTLLCALSLSLGRAALAAAESAQEQDRMFFLPDEDGISQPFVGDCMPYYEDGVYYIYYLKEGGVSFRHSVYLVTTEDSVGVFYIEDTAAFTVRMYGTAGKPVYLFARENTVTFENLALRTRQ